jgi:tRNA-splicing ligase RtcB
MIKINLKKISDFTWEIPQEGNMLVPGKIFASEKLLRQIITDESLHQVKNVATLPGILKYSIAMPDIHEGYGFPIGGVAAVDIDEGFISPGGVGYDINCGVRLLKTNLFYNDIKNKVDKILAKLFTTIPSGIGSKNAIKKLSNKEFIKVLKNGSQWAVENGFGIREDLNFTENNGYIENEGYKFVSERAVDRGKEQLGTLGSGNHFLEIDIVEKVFDKKFTDYFGLDNQQVLILFHTGSRGFGYQVCDDFLKLMRKNISKFNYNPPDKQLVALPFKSDIGQKYFNCMNSAANFAWANRQIIKSLIEKALLDSLNISPNQLKLEQIYDVSHNIAKIEKFYNKKILVHRKGATRAFDKDSTDIPTEYKNIGQPIIIPGDMGSASYLLVGLANARTQSFASCCHGAGRVLSRKKAIKKFNNHEIVENLKNKGIYILAKNKRTIAEEVPEAYKDIDEVVKVVSQCGLAEKVAKFKPIAVIKG